MKLIEALQKWDKVTNDNGKTVYSTNSDGTIIMRTNGAGGGFKPTVELFTSTGWERYAIPLVLPYRYIESNYYWIDEEGKIDYFVDEDCTSDEPLFEMYNYFYDKELAQYVSDKQLILRIKITLEHLNKNNPDKEMLILEYINDNYKDVIDRIKQYEEGNIKYRF